MSNKVRKKTVKVVRHNFEGGVEQLLDRHKKFIDEWVEKFNALAKIVNTQEDRLKAVAISSAQEFGKLLANQQTLANSIDHIDTNVLVTAKVLKEIFGQLQQIDDIFLAMKGQEVPVPDVDREDVMEKAELWFNGIVAGAFKAVREEMKAAQEAKDKAKAEAEAAAKTAAEAKTAEEVLQKAEEKTMAPPGGQGADIPEGAQLFGG